MYFQQLPLGALQGVFKTILKINESCYWQMWHYIAHKQAVLLRPNILDTYVTEKVKQ